MYLIKSHKTQYDKSFSETNIIYNNKIVLFKLDSILFNGICILLNTQKTNLTNTIVFL